MANTHKKVEGAPQVLTANRLLEGDVVYLTELDTLLAREPGLAPVIRPIIDGRLNWTDRRISRLER